MPLTVSFAILSPLLYMYKLTSYMFLTKQYAAELIDFLKVLCNNSSLACWLRRSRSPSRPSRLRRSKLPSRFEKVDLWQVYWVDYDMLRLFVVFWMTFFTISCISLVKCSPMVLSSAIFSDRRVNSRRQNTPTNFKQKATQAALIFTGIFNILFTLSFAHLSQKVAFSFIHKILVHTSY